VPNDAAMSSMSSGVVERHGRMDRRGEPESPEYRLGTMMAGPHRNPVAVEVPGDCVRLDAIDDE
jgi:hypothetical protein